jgi:hypothetical protein
VCGALGHQGLGKDKNSRMYAPIQRTDSVGPTARVDAELDRIVCGLALDTDPGSREEDEGRPPHHLPVLRRVRVCPHHEHGRENLDHDHSGGEDLPQADR